MTSGVGVSMRLQNPVYRSLLEVPGGVEPCREHYLTPHAVRRVSSFTPSVRTDIVAPGSVGEKGCANSDIVHGNRHIVQGEADLLERFFSGSL